MFHSDAETQFQYMLWQIFVAINEYHLTGHWHKTVAEKLTFKTFLVKAIFLLAKLRQRGITLSMSSKQMELYTLNSKFWTLYNTISAEKFYFAPFQAKSLKSLSLFLSHILTDPCPQHCWVVYIDTERRVLNWRDPCILALV